MGSGRQGSGSGFEIEGVGLSGAKGTLSFGGQGSEEGHSRWLGFLWSRVQGFKVQGLGLRVGVKWALSAARVQGLTPCSLGVVPDTRPGRGGGVRTRTLRRSALLQ